MKARLAVAAFLICAASPSAWGWDKAPSPQKRLEILQGATRRNDAGELGSCYAPPFDQAIAEVWKGSQRHDAAVVAIGDAIVAKMDPAAFAGTPLEFANPHETFSPFHFALKGEFTIGEIKPDPQNDKKAHAVVTLGEDQHGCKGLVTTILLVKVKDDWRIVFDEQEWPEKASVESIARGTLEIGRSLEKAGGDFEKIAADLNNAMGETIPPKEKLVERYNAAAEPVKKAITAYRTARTDALGAEKAAKEKAVQTEKDAADKAKADAEAKAKAEADAKKAEAKAKADAAKAALPPPLPPPPPAVAKKDEPAPDEDKPAESKSDSTGMFIVFGLLGLACVVVVGIVISKAKEQEGGGKRRGGGGGGGGGGSSKSGSARHKRRRK